MLKLHQFKIAGDSRGSLIALETLRQIPFEFKRVYYIFGTKPGVDRGFHSHKTLQQMLISVHGSCIIELDSGFEKESCSLDDPSIGLYIGPGIWHVMKEFSEDCVLLVLASDYYTEDDYIRNYNDFLSSKTKNQEHV